MRLLVSCALVALLQLSTAARLPAAVEQALGRQLLSEKDHKYAADDKVPLWASKVGPFTNPSETYEYYSLPYCQPKDGVKHKLLGMGEVVDANRMASTPYQLQFRKNRQREAVCEQILDQEKLLKFRKAVEEDWYFQMYYDDLPVWGFIGKMEKLFKPGGVTEYKYYLFTHIDFDIKYNEDRVIEINVSTDPQEAVDISEEITDSVKAKFTYSVKWTPTLTKFEQRLARYERFPLNPVHLEIHWFSIINSCVTVLLLTGFLATILMRVLKADFIKYNKDDPAMDEEESGWKYVHGDVFRFPPYKNLFCAFVGTGTQLFYLALFVFVLALVGVFYPYNRGALYSALIALYALTAGIAGFVASSYYKQMEGELWVRNILLTCFVYCGPFLLMFSFLNTVAIVYRSTAALPFGTIVIMILIWVLVTIPLTVFGGIAGKNNRAEFFAPCRTNKYPREIPQLPWYRTTVPQMVMAGFLPFSAIYVELYYIFASVWGHKVYIIWSILAIVYIILIIVTAFITIALTYFQLAVEDHQWWWRSFLCGGSTGIFVYGYCFYYYYARSDMSGFMQTSFFFGYMAMVCFGFFLMLGTVGWRASLMFVRHIYRAIKCE
ncbi:hypothetical protein HYH02_005871 [Chlamydomonas schloesseri]|uniref:Transmembrane 9 superfamily member n=1 Tax=Chlamydomonas schloesseri TaxID=2026947 RepID=A0A836B6S5_9CHLO|nr:hypothetical protein HYH02_005871 [Chlamydomonas schloesseri]|eukprot:KAG2449123.1 hypothetical protein HYH02_005871 [Chlamydomonas schloesseri]